jgi:hypothetical protein
MQRTFLARVEMTAFFSRLCLPRRARRPRPAECRPKFISVVTWGVRFWERSTLSIGFNFYGNCYNPLYCASCGTEASAIQGEARLRGRESCALLQK